MKNQSFNKSCKIVLNLLTFNIGKLNNIWVISKMVENSGIEPLTSCVQSRRSPSWANSPRGLLDKNLVFLFFLLIVDNFKRNDFLIILKVVEKFLKGVTLKVMTKKTLKTLSKE